MPRLFVVATPIGNLSDMSPRALEVLRTVTGCLPDAEEIAFRSFQYRRDESVKLSGTAGVRGDLYSLIENLTDAKFDDEEPLFAKVDPGNERPGKKSVSFAIECFFHAEDEEQGGRSRK